MKWLLLASAVAARAAQAAPPESLPATGLAPAGVSPGMTIFWVSTNGIVKASTNPPVAVKPTRPAARLRVSPSPAGTNLIVLPAQTNPPGWLPPGVYQAAPYSTLVLVPEPTADDICIINPAGPTPSMPMAKPELRFTPKR